MPVAVRQTGASCARRSWATERQFVVNDTASTVGLSVHISRVAAIALLGEVVVSSAVAPRVIVVPVLAHLPPLALAVTVFAMHVALIALVVLHDGDRHGRDSPKHWCRRSP